MQVTKGLGYRYLWVDKYCIDQRNPSEKADQIGKMDLIYSNAELVIIAAAGPDERYGLPGVGSTPRFTQQVVRFNGITALNTAPNPIAVVYKSEWWRRGWTFQECLLPRRRLIFTEHESFFECSCANWRESLGGVEHIADPRSVAWDDWVPWMTLLRTEGHLPFQQDSRRTRALLSNTHHFGPLIEALYGPIRHCLRGVFQPKDTRPNARQLERIEDALARRFFHFSNLVSRYTTRVLTNDADSLRAVKGILVFLARSPYPTLNIAGLPYVPLDHSLREFAELETVAALSWYHDERNASLPRRRPDFPSWTWAGWAGSVRWLRSEHVHMASRNSMTPRLRELALESANGVVSSAPDYLQIREPLDNCPDSAVAFHFEAPLVHVDCFSFAQGHDHWHDVRVRGRKTWAEERARAPTETPTEFVQRLKDGSWSCLWVSDHFEGGQFPEPGSEYFSFLLVVEWREDGTATRTGALFLVSNLDTTVKPAALIPEREVQWAKVRLV
ncbi:hypothetical protein OQA88_12515 [Cercophora sp. LCS_1]